MTQSNSQMMNEHIAFMGEFMTNINALTTGLLRDLREQYNISNEQSSVLLMLSRDNALTLTEITMRQGVNKAAVSRRVKKLVELNLVKWVNMTYEHDKRLKYIALTESGRHYVHASRHLIASLATKMLSDIPIDQLSETRHVLEKIDQRVASQLKQL
ncbi:MarR family transcriptional regulator [Staphylococcus felis]|uniref:MarR family transcriptional regulator n=2 Tax=Staphylococcus felis TaxID=46127 RepID=A0ABS0QPI8_9STAP|nr:MarR family transcriptional regulator [Staphylococcus felis]AVP36388.1 MarR family transcriptional regulator [Staphylococcus felis]MBH9581044.1 MarR family transcriptional regulator [Staphylococcus felis]MDM8327951.1 MarR family transcriptional regulator [Staphylococcus felis]MDQ7193135.1 MarR family transcriptional regulator [Staphylococcus felis]PNZ34348.1 MarR family transcriptional regulator [Staphylococcus felis]